MRVRGTHIPGTYELLDDDGNVCAQLRQAGPGSDHFNIFTHSSSEPSGQIRQVGPGSDHYNVVFSLDERIGQLVQDPAVPGAAFTYRPSSRNTYGTVEAAGNVNSMFSSSHIPTVGRYGETQTANTNTMLSCATTVCNVLMSEDNCVSSFLRSFILGFSLGGIFWGVALIPFVL